MDINYELYKVFYYVASTLSFSEASKQLFISQSAVSQSIKALEKKLDQTLFIRSTKKVRLTTEGEILLRHIEPAISLIKRGESQLLDVGVRGGQLHIGASDTICRYFLVPYLERFHREFPGAHIKVTNATSIRCVELLETEKFIDDERFCRAFVNDKFRFSKWGKMKIAQGLYMKKIPSDVAWRYLNEIDEEEYLSVLRDLLASKRKSIHASDDYELNGKLMRFAMSRGFELKDIKRCIDVPEEEELVD